MKRCPQCNRVETDDALAFCRADGSALVGDHSAPGGEAGTARPGTAPAASEIETSILPHTTDAAINRAAAPTTAPRLLQPTGATGELTRPKRRALIAGALLAASLLAVAGYFHLTRKEKAAIESIAVLPFVNESDNTDAEYLSDGMTETLIGSLSQLPNLNVKARSSVFPYKGRETNAQTVGNELNVQAILTGRVVQRGQDLILYLELVDAQTGNQIWGEQYNRKQADLISLQSEIARDVSNKLRVKLSGADEQKLAKNYTENAEAYQLYLKGRFYWNKRTPDNFRKAIEYFNQALITEPNYALAYTGLADTYALLAVYTGGEPPREVIPKAKDAALKALSLDNNLAEAHAALGQILHNYDYDFDGAEREYKRAIELNPNYASAYQWYGELLAGLGRHEEALGKLRNALEIDSLSLIINRVFGFALYYARQYDASIAQLKKTVELDANLPGSHLDLYKAHWMKGNYAESVEELAKWSELLGKQQDASLMRESFAKGGCQGFLRAMTGTRRPSSLKSCNVAAFYAALGEKDKAIRELAEGYDKRESDIMWLKVDPQLDPLRDDPRFQDLLRRIGLPQ